MDPAPTPPPPGNLTVPPLFGWEEIVTVLGIVIAGAAAFLVIAAIATAWTGRAEWRAYLDARSRRDH
ncbi:hypothetical protein GCM10010531_21380 [Blastococcus jejuensis]|uniref:Uncharacterized protein n=1 Tax=Blastococcus jejuensis TaxID=351224 RepID=A0ABP6P5M0_9ACTN